MCHYLISAEEQEVHVYCTLLHENTLPTLRRDGSFEGELNILLSLHSYLGMLTPSSNRDDLIGSGNECEVMPGTQGGRGSDWDRALKIARRWKGNQWRSDDVNVRADDLSEHLGVAELLRMRAGDPSEQLFDVAALLKMKTGLNLDKLWDDICERSKKE